MKLIVLLLMVAMTSCNDEPTEKRPYNYTKKSTEIPIPKDSSNVLRTATVIRHSDMLGSKIDEIEYDTVFIPRRIICLEGRPFVSHVLLTSAENSIYQRNDTIWVKDHRLSPDNSDATTYVIDK